jgi:hypothetical protein
MSGMWGVAENVVELLAGLSTVAVAWFAWVQIRHMRGDSNERQRAAYASLYAEYLRLSALSDAWQDEDFLELSYSHALRPDDLLPPDWGTLIRLLGEVGSGTAALGGMAYEMITEGARRIRLINDLTERLQPNQAEADVRTLERQVKNGIKQAAETFEDAMRSAPSWLTTHPFTVVHPRSEIGRRVEAELMAAQKRTLGERHEARLGRVGRFMGRRLARVARWFDPASAP